ncbi:MAG: molybdopterin-dependent oxidoreductase, partial [Sphingorhabdus sp.]
MKNDRDIIGRRALLRSATLGGSALVLGGCDALNKNDTFRSALRTAESLNNVVHRSLMDRAALAPEFAVSDISPVFKTNGSLSGTSAEYLAHVSNNFADWKLRIDGMVANPLDVSLEMLRGMPARTQITRHDCVEGWSAIAKWQGTPLRLL